MQHPRWKDGSLVLIGQRASGTELDPGNPGEIDLITDDEICFTLDTPIDGDLISLCVFYKDGDATGLIRES